MLLRRLYSSPASRAAAAPLEASSTTRAPTRGRSRPVRVALKRTPVVAPIVAAEPTRGRRLRRALAPAPVAETTSETPFATQFSFRPVTLYPFQAGLHLGFTPAHMPLPVHAGTASYLQPGRGATAFFERPAAPSALDALSSAPASNGSSLGDHLRLTRAFAHPAMSHHLGQQSAAPSVAVLDVDHDAQVTAALDAAASRHAEAAGSVWDAALARLGGRVAEPAAPSAAEQASLDDALKGLNGLLARLDVAAVDEVVSLDSVRRKRKKRMNKHKYQKRRKASRAERKRLGK